MKFGKLLSKSKHCFLKKYVGGVRVQKKVKLVSPFPYNKQFTKKQAIAFHDSYLWKDMEMNQLAILQMYQNKLCVPFDKFHEAMQKLLGRPVFTHEFAFRDNLIREMVGLKRKSNFEKIINLIPREKLILIGI